MFTWFNYLWTIVYNYFIPNTNKSAYVDFNPLMSYYLSDTGGFKPDRHRKRKCYIYQVDDKTTVLNFIRNVFEYKIDRFSTPLKRLETYADLFKKIKGILPDKVGGEYIYNGFYDINYKLQCMRKNYTGTVEKNNKIVHIFTDDVVDIHTIICIIGGPELLDFEDVEPSIPTTHPLTGQGISLDNKKATTTYVKFADLPCPEPENELEEMIKHNGDILDDELNDELDDEENKFWIENHKPQVDEPEVDEPEVDEPEEDEPEEDEPEEDDKPNIGDKEITTNMVTPWYRIIIDPWYTN